MRKETVGIYILITGIVSGRPIKQQWSLRHPMECSRSRNSSSFLWPFFGSTASRLDSHYTETLFFTTKSPEIPRIYSFDWPWKDERLNWPCSHPVVLILGTPGMGIQCLNHYIESHELKPIIHTYKFWC